MKIKFFTLCALFSLFSYSNDPLSLNTLDGKILVCSDLRGLDSNLENSPPFFSIFGYQGFIFNEKSIENQYIYWIQEKEESSGDFIPSKSSLGSRKGEVFRVTTQYISFRIFKSQDQWQAYHIDRKNLNLLGGSNLNKNCVVAKDRETYNKFMKNRLISNQEYIDKSNLDRRKKQIEEMKDNQI